MVVQVRTTCAHSKTSIFHLCAPCCESRKRFIAKRWWNLESELTIHTVILPQARFQFHYNQLIHMEQITFRIDSLFLIHNFCRTPKSCLYGKFKFINNITMTIVDFCYLYVGILIKLTCLNCFFFFIFDSFISGCMKLLNSFIIIIFLTFAP